MSSRYQSTNYVPWIAGAVLLAVFVGVVVWATGDDEKQDATWNPPPVKRTQPDPEPEMDPEPEPDPEPQPKPRMSAARAAKYLKRATLSWRQYAVKLCRKQKWDDDKAVAFLEAVTWNDRDKEKQHAQGLKALAKMAGVAPGDDVELAMAIEEFESVEDFFDKNWSKLDVKYENKEPEVVVLDDAWKSTRERWGFPLDTPIDTLQQFKMAQLPNTMRVWQQLAVGYIRSQTQNDQSEAQAMALRTLGQGVREQEAKMKAGMRVLLSKPKATVKELVEALAAELEGKDEQAAQQVIQTLLERMPDAVKAAADAQ